MIVFLSVCLKQCFWWISFLFAASFSMFIVRKDDSLEENGTPNSVKLWHNDSVSSSLAELKKNAQAEKAMITMYGRCVVKSPIWNISNPFPVRQRYKKCRIFRNYGADICMLP